MIAYLVPGIVNPITYATGVTVGDDYFLTSIDYKGATVVGTEYDSDGEKRGFTRNGSQTASNYLYTTESRIRTIAKEITTPSTYSVFGKYVTTNTTVGKSSNIVTTVINVSKTTTGVGFTTAQTNYSEVIVTTCGLEVVGRMSDTYYEATGQSVNSTENTKEVLWSATNNAEKQAIVAASNNAVSGTSFVVSAYSKTITLPTINTSNETSSCYYSEVTEAVSGNSLQNIFTTTSAINYGQNFDPTAFNVFPVTTFSLGTNIQSVVPFNFTTRIFASISVTGASVTKISTQTGYSWSSEQATAGTSTYNLLEDYVKTTRTVTIPVQDFCVSSSSDYGAGTWTSCESRNAFSTEVFYGAPKEYYHRVYKLVKAVYGVVDSNGDIKRSYSAADNVPSFACWRLYDSVYRNVVSIKPGSEVIYKSTTPSGSFIPFGSISNSHLSATVTTTRSASGFDDTATSGSTSFKFVGHGEPGTKYEYIGFDELRTGVGSCGKLGKSQTMYVTSQRGVYRGAKSSRKTITEDIKSSYTGGSGAEPLIAVTYLDRQRGTATNETAFVWLARENNPGYPDEI